MSRSFHVGPFCGHYTSGLFWFRAFGRGFHIKDTRRHPLRFSERNGYTNFWAIRKLHPAAITQPTLSAPPSNPHAPDGGGV